MTFFNIYLAAQQPTLGHYQEDSLTHPLLITAFLQFWPEGHQEPCNKVGSLSPTKHLMSLNQEPSDSNCITLTHYLLFTIYYDNIHCENCLKLVEITIVVCPKLAKWQ